jgi:hypothetical protein
VYVHRFRDVDATIRALCAENLGSWVKVYPELFLSDQYLKYLAWTLNDRDTTVRAASIQAILALHEDQSEENLRKLELFDGRFMARFQELASDVDSNVAAMAVALITTLLKYEHFTFLCCQFI